MHPLDRPVWASLTSHMAAWAEGGPLALRFQRDVQGLASAADDSAAAAQALADLVRPGEQVYIVQATALQVPPGLVALKAAPALQMLGTVAATDTGDTHDVLELGDADAPEMVALAQLTRPGPFKARTHRLGRFIGVRHQGRLVAMAGERMRQPGFTEVSGVCTHPSCRGQGLARRLSALVAAHIRARGEQPYLHVWADNTAAIALYESLGFRVRATVNVAQLECPA